MSTTHSYNNSLINSLSSLIEIMIRAQEKTAYIGIPGKYRFCVGKNESVIMGDLSPEQIAIINSNADSKTNFYDDENYMRTLKLIKLSEDRFKIQILDESIKSNIMIVDDDYTYSNVLRLLCLEIGYQAEVAYSLDEAINKFNVATTQLVITDYYLADHRGSELVKKIKDKKKTTEIIVVSSELNEELEEECAMLGADLAISKNKNYQTVKAWIKNKADKVLTNNYLNNIQC